jgi:hypothetical protein
MIHPINLSDIYNILMIILRWCDAKIWAYIIVAGAVQIIVSGPMK